MLVTLAPYMPIVVIAIPTRATMLSFASGIRQIFSQLQICLSRQTLTFLQGVEKKTGDNIAGKKLVGSP